jgi:hypothetical protein
MLLTDVELGEVSDDHSKFLKVLKTKVKDTGLPWDAKPAATTVAA